MTEYLCKEDMSTGEYISRDELLKALTQECKDCEYDDPYRCEQCDFAIAMSYARHAPKSDVQPVKHGRWLNHHAIWIDQPEIEGWFVQAKCSECKKWAHVMNPYTKSVDYECCPNCGARMNVNAE